MTIPRNPPRVVDKENRNSLVVSYRHFELAAVNGAVLAFKLFLRRFLLKTTKNLAVNNDVSLLNYFETITRKLFRKLYLNSVSCCIKSRKRLNLLRCCAKSERKSGASVSKWFLKSAKSLSWFFS